MSLFGLDHSLPYSKTKAAARERRIQEGLRNLSESRAIAKEIEASQKETAAQMYLEDTVGRAINKGIVSRRRRFKEESRLQESLTRKLLVGFLTETTINGLVFDEEFIDANIQSIRTEATRIFDEMFNEGTLSESSFAKCKSILVQEAYQELKDIAKWLSDNKDTINVYNENVISQILSEANKSKELSDEIAENVKDKVTDTLEKEKKISKKKEEEKKKDEEEKEAADSLDNDVDDETGEGGEGGDAPDEPPANAPGEDGDDGEPGEPEEPSDDSEPEGGDTPEDPPGDDGEPGEPEEPSDSSDPNSGDSSTPPDAPPGEAPDGGDANGGEPPAPEDPNASPDASTPDAAAPSDSSAAPATGVGAKTTLTIDNKGTKITVVTESSDIRDYINIFGKQRYNDRNSKTLFRNMMEMNLQEQVGMLNEGANNIINMDNVLGETIIQYTLLETLHTSRLFDLTAKQIKSISKALNFKRK